jgi:hypothetical protein
MTAGGKALLVIRAAALTTAVKLDTIAGASDAVAFAAAVRGNAGWGGASGGAGRGQRWHGAVRLAVRLVILLKLGLVLDGGLAEAGGQSGKGSLGVLLLDDVAGLAWASWLWGLDLASGSGLWDLAGSAAGGLGLLGSWDIDDVELAAGGWLDGELDGGVVRDGVSVHLVVVPVALASLELLGGEAESALPGTLLGVLGEWELTLVAVPGADEVDGLDGRAGAESKAEGDGRHFYIGFEMYKFVSVGVYVD